MCFVIIFLSVARIHARTNRAKILIIIHQCNFIFQHSIPSHLKSDKQERQPSRPVPENNTMKHDKVLKKIGPSTCRRSDLIQRMDDMISPPGRVPE